VGAGYTADAKDLRERYEKWYEEIGLEPLSKRFFGLRLGERFPTDRSRRRRLVAAHTERSAPDLGRPRMTTVCPYKSTGAHLAQMISFPLMRARARTLIQIKCANCATFIP
jgi:hypothetical protein